MSNQLSRANLRNDCLYRSIITATLIAVPISVALDRYGLVPWHKGFTIWGVVFAVSILILIYKHFCPKCHKLWSYRWQDSTILGVRYNNWHYLTLELRHVLSKYKCILCGSVFNKRERKIVELQIPFNFPFKRKDKK